MPDLEDALARLASHTADCLSSSDGFTQFTDFGIRCLTARGIQPVWRAIFGEEKAACFVGHREPMTAKRWPCFSRRESTIFGKPKSNFPEPTNVVRQRVRECLVTNFSYIRVVSGGQFGRVYLVSEKSTGLFFAMKEVDKKTQKAAGSDFHCDRELNVMTEVKSSWLVELLNHYDLPSKRCLLMEFVPGKSLLELVKANDKLPVRQVQIYAAEMLACLHSLHSHGYIHGDIKLANFRLDMYGHLKLCNFSFCKKFIPPYTIRQVFPPSLNFWEEPPHSVLARRKRIIARKQQLFTVPYGTWLYCAPEVIKFTRTEWCRVNCTGYSFLCDFWSYGVCVYYLLFGHPPFQSHNKPKVPHLIVRWEHTLRFKSRRGIPDTAVDLIKKLLCEERSRLGAGGFHEVARHSFFAPVRWEGLGYRRRQDRIHGPDTLEAQDSDQTLAGNCVCLEGLRAWLCTNSKGHPQASDAAGQVTPDNKRDQDNVMLSASDTGTPSMSSAFSSPASPAQSQRGAVPKLTLAISRSGSSVDEVLGSWTESQNMPAASVSLLAVNQLGARTPSVSLRAASLDSLRSIAGSPPPPSPASGASSVTASSYVTASSSLHDVTP